MSAPTDAPERRCPICNQPKTGRNPIPVRRLRGQGVSADDRPQER